MTNNLRTAGRNGPAAKARAKGEALKLARMMDPNHVGFRTHVFQFVIALVFILGGVLGVRQGLELGVLSAGESQEKVHPAAAYLDQTLEDLIGQSYEELSKMRGDPRTVAMKDPDNRYKLDVKVSRMGMGLLEIQGRVIDSETGEEVDRVKTYCAR
jgi:hypothetical protein